MSDWKEEVYNLYHSAFYSPNPLRAIKKDKIILYGAGEMGEMALDFLKLSNIEPKYIVDKFKTGHIKNFPIVHPKKISFQEKQEHTIIVCIAKNAINPVYEELKSLNFIDIRHFYDLSELLFPDEMSNGWIEQSISIEKLHFVLDLLKHDLYSIQHFIQFLWWRLKRKEVIKKEFPVLSDKKFFKAPCIPTLKINERFLDAGAHQGQSTLSFLENTNHQYEKVWLFEPDDTNRKITKQALKNITNIEISHKALSNKVCQALFQDNLDYASKIFSQGNRKIECTTIDALALNPTIIKLHIEGYELPALEGAINTIKQYRPILMVLADHNNDGIYKIPLFLSQLQNYSLFFYLHDYCGNTAVYYAIPKERNQMNKLIHGE